MPRLLLSPRSLPPYVLFIALFPLTLLFHKHLPTLGVLLFQQVLFPRPTSSTPPHPPYPPAHLCIFLLERTHLPISYMATLFGRKSETRSKKSLTKRDTRERHNEYHLFHLVHRSPPDQQTCVAPWLHEKWWWCGVQRSRQANLCRMHAVKRRRATRSSAALPSPVCPNGVGAAWLSWRVGGKDNRMGRWGHGAWVCTGISVGCANVVACMPSYLHV
ncbi:hypothetical protein HDK77DRAFT_159885 [Phyllosticta capitalensis]